MTILHDLFHLGMNRNSDRLTCFLLYDLDEAIVSEIPRLEAGYVGIAQSCDMEGGCVCRLDLKELEIPMIG